jgi:heme-degrading monooxygenase HmoA
MFIAMNRFRVKRGSEEAFEKVWLTRDTYLDCVPGFMEFHLLKGPETEDHTLYASHTIWQSKAAFEAWTKSEEFRAAHARAATKRPARFISSIPNSRASMCARSWSARPQSHEVVLTPVGAAARHR